MINIISHTGNIPYIGHFQGKCINKYVDVVEEYGTKEVKIDESISVIMAFNDKEKAISALQLELSKMPYTNACKDLNRKWSNVLKIEYFLEELKKTTSEYSLLTDAYDVVFFKDLDKEFIYKFERMNKKIIFNATKNNHPNFKIDTISNRCELGEFKYLNAGIVFGKTKDLIEFYEEALENTKRNDIRNPWESEQLFIRMTSDGKEYVGIDSECILFQTFSKTNRTECGNSVIIV